MKYAPPAKSALPHTRTPVPATHLPTNVDGGLEIQVPGFFSHIIKSAGITKKEIQFDLRVSQTLVDLWKSGERIDPLTRALECVEMFRRKGRADLVPTILIYIAGAFDGRILTAQQTDALRELAKAVNE
jgi:hypothetical protein